MGHRRRGLRALLLLATAGLQACADDAAPAWVVDGAVGRDGGPTFRDGWNPRPGDRGAGDALADAPPVDGPLPLVDAQVLGPDAASGNVVEPFSDVAGASCNDGWLDTGRSVAGAQCTAHLERLKLGVGSGPEPDRFGCRVAGSGGAVEAYLYELGCDDADGVAVACAGLCGPPDGFSRGTVELSGGTFCADGWKPTGTKIAAGLSCRAFVGDLTVGIGSGAEPATYGCRYNAATGDIEAYLYELGCDDGGVALRCDWVCAPGGAATTNTYKTTLCQAGWQPLATAVGKGRPCTAGIELMRLGAGAGPEPDEYGCRYDATADRVEGYLHELACDAAGIELQCATICLP